MTDNNQPLYQQIFKNLLDGIQTGKYKIGDRLPSEKELAEEFDVSRITSKKALAMLAEEGLIKRMPGKGSFVSQGSDNNGTSVIKPEKHKQTVVTIGVIISDFSESYGTLLLSGIEKESAERNSFIVLRRSNGEQEQEEKAIEALLDMGVDGMIIMPVHGEHYNPKILRLILDGFPIVMVDRQLKGIPAPFIGTDNILAAKRAADYLLALGHKNISFISPPPISTSVIEDRLEGFIKSHMDHGVVADESLWVMNLTSTLPGNNEKANILSDIETISRQLRENRQITCLLATEYNIGLMALEAVRSMKLRVPQDISILCFDGPLNYAGEYFFTHIRQKEIDMGSMAVSFLMQQISGEEVIEKIYLEVDLVIGQSTAEMHGQSIISI